MPTLMGVGFRPDGSTVAISIEGKCDEAFDATLGSVRKRAHKIEDAGGRTNAKSRVDELVRSLLGLGPAKAVTDKLRYQLFTGIAGTLAYARNVKADTAVFIIHELRSSLAKPRALARNARDLWAFVVELTGGAIQDIPEGQLIGPIRIPGTPLFESPAPLLLGKVARDVGPSCVRQ
jgi:hypothetical protein